MPSITNFKRTPDNATERRLMMECLIVNSSLPDHTDPEYALPHITTVESPLQKKMALSRDGGPFRFLQRPINF